jgi:site-specific DNA-methyltransferase (adenine-specific)/adenine-specific DNA-methyltransferase
MLLSNEVYQGDCLDLIEQVDDESVDLVICDGPYGVTDNNWDRIDRIQDYNFRLVRLFARVLRKGGALYLFGKHDCLDFVDYRPYLRLNSRIVWYQPSRLAQGRTNYTNNYDIIAYFTKGKPKTFNLDSVRVPQLVELEHRLRCERVPSVVNGKYSKTKFNEKGKNPGDVWGDIKQLTYRSKELLSRSFLNTIQKPVKLLKRIILASSNAGDLVLDPFAGTGTSLVVCQELGRDFIGFEINPSFVAVCRQRLEQAGAKHQQALFA